ncbi:hypothetical protein HDU78_010922 [Chytriomyces hyalinus]|nr:hypothetical protein HDU78_010922 [Chytriomyces hyalinus]
MKVHHALSVGISYGIAVGTINANRKLHNECLNSVMNAPMSFFETNPLGRIISRFSKDFSEVDRQLPVLIQQVMESTLSLIGTVVLIAYAVPLCLVLVVILFPLYLHFLKFFRASIRELKRLENLSRSPLYAHISETLSGLSTIRSYDRMHDFYTLQNAFLDAGNQPIYLKSVAECWMSNRAESFIAVLIFAVALVGLVTNADAPLLGLGLSYALALMAIVNGLLPRVADLEARMNSIERIFHYITELPSEKKEHDASVSESWPTKGMIEFNRFSLRYRDDLDPVLHDLSFRIPAGEKVGVVGRTGAGKSTIITAAFRLVEGCEGSISIDGVDVGKLSLDSLRSRLAIIPQAPTLFEGTIRFNLDPLHECDDEDIWHVLGRCALKEYVSMLDQKLDSPVLEGGANLSVGQRQLLCLGRAMLRKSKLLFIDEATASVDVETDSFIQQVIREEFEDATVVCIAHRLGTLIDYDKIMVLDAGELIEYDAPHVLLRDPGSSFSSLVDEMGESSASMLRGLAETAFYASYNAISQLNLRCQKQRLATPRFEIESTQGAAHTPQFKMAVTVNERRFVGSYWSPSKAMAKAEVAAAALVGLGWAPAESGSVAREDPVQPVRAEPIEPSHQPVEPPPPITQAKNSEDGAPAPLIAADNWAISQFYDLARTQNVNVTDMYHPTAQGFKCYFMWGTRQLPMSDSHVRKKDAKLHAAQLGLAEIASSITKSLSTEVISKSMDLSTPPAETQQSSSSSSSLPSFESPSQVHSSSLNAKPLIPPPTQQPVDPTVILASLYKIQYPLDPSPPIYTEMSTAAGFQYAVALNGRVVATSDVFVTKHAAKRHAAQSGLQILIQWSQDAKKRKRTESGSQSGGASVASNTLLNSISAECIDADAFGRLPDLSVGEGGPDRWDVLADCFSKSLGGSGDMRKCTLNIIASVRLALQQHSELNIDRVVVSGAFGRGTNLIFDTMVELVLVRNRSDAVQPEGTLSSALLCDNAFHSLVVHAIEKSTISSCVRFLKPFANDGSVHLWYNGIQSVRFCVVEGVNFAPAGDKCEDIKVPRYRQIMHHGTALLELRNQLINSIDNVDSDLWNSTLSESTALFFRNHAFSAPLARLLKYWALSLSFSSNVSRLALSNVLDYVAAYAWDQMERALSEFDPKRASLSLALETALRFIENNDKMRIFWTEFYTRDEIQSKISSTASFPLLLDPVNPFRNLYDSIPKSAWNAMATCAKSSRDGIFEQVLPRGSDFVRTAFNPQLRTAFDVLYLYTSVSITTSKDPFNFTIPDFQLKPVTGCTPSSSTTTAQETLEEGEISEKRSNLASMQTLKLSSEETVESLARLLQANLAMQIFAFQFKSTNGRPEDFDSGVAVSGGAVGHAEVSMMVEAAIATWRGSLRVACDAGVGVRPEGALVGCLLLPVFAKFAVSIEMAVKV